MKWLACIMSIVLGSAAVSFACWITQSAEPLWGLILVMFLASEVKPTSPE